MSEVGRTAIRIGALFLGHTLAFAAEINIYEGEQLESVHLQRERAQAAYDLIDYYNQFSKDDVSRIEALRKEGKEGRRRVAVLLRRLSTVAKEVDLPTAEKVRFTNDVLVHY